MIQIRNEIGKVLSIRGHAAKTKAEQTHDAIAACASITAIAETLAAALDKKGEQWRTTEQEVGRMTIYTHNADKAALILIDAATDGLKGMSGVYPDYIDYQDI